MTAPLLWLWPKSLAGRLVLLLVAALAVAQLVLALVFRNQEDAVAEAMAHGQALAQTVALARLLDAYPASESERLVTAFGSKFSCARVSDAPAPAHAMSAPERRLADLIAVMLHGVNVGAPQVTIQPLMGDVHPCGAGPRPDRRAVGDEDDGRRAGPPEFRSRFANVAIAAPLSDGRWLTFTTAVHAPSGWTRATTLSFLLSCLSVSAVAFVAVRAQTRSLRALAEASERLGRGESVPPLSTTGPSEVAAAARAFNTMQERLGAFIRDRLKLLAGVSHDLRTPLTTLRLKAEFIDDEAVREDVVTTIDEMTAICEATLAFTRAEAATEATETVDLPKLVEEIVEPFRLAGENIVFAPSQPFDFLCRPVSLKRAVRNLIENAVRYGGGARVSAFRASDAVGIRIEDDGPGLPEDQIEDAFKPFVRLEASRSMETGGIGLGLAIARSIVKAHGGSLTLANRSQGGLRAEIRLPVQRR